MDYLSKALANAPHACGVYLYLNMNREIIYVGKAVDLYRRTHQYFQSTVSDEKTKQLVSRIASIKYIQTKNEFEALLLESSLIHTHQPQYNIIARDDKSALYIRISLSEILPHITAVRKSIMVLDTQSKNVYFGPFQSSRIVRNILGRIRSVIPYCTQKQRNGRPCFYTHLGLCNPCPSAITNVSDPVEKKQLTALYRSHIYAIRDILQGKSKKVIRALTVAMRDASKKQNFEQAAAIKKQLDCLYALVDMPLDVEVYIQDQYHLDRMVHNELEALRSILTPFIAIQSSLRRIECVDISNLFGHDAVGSLVVLSDGIVDTQAYRKFKIRFTYGHHDAAMIEEVIERRWSHPEWPYPDLLCVDGGKPQVASAKTLCKKKGITVPIIGLAKRREEIIIAVGDQFKSIQLPLTSPALHVIQRLRDEAHRFAISYHRKIRNKKLFSV